MTHLMRDTYALILAGGRGARLQQLTEWRAKPSVPFAGKFSIIDFALSNCVNSGARRIGVLTQYKSQSLIRHIERGWGFLEANLGEYIDVVPAQQRVDERWYSGTANAVFQNLDILREADPRYVLVLSGDHVYKMDYSIMLAEHVERGAEVTVACLDVPLSEAGSFGVMGADADDRVISFAEKPLRPAGLPGDPSRALVSMGIYVFNAEVLFEQLMRDARLDSSSHDFGHDLLPHLVSQRRVWAHRFASSCVNRIGERPYWRDVGTVDAFWAANIDLTRELPELNLYDDQWPILSRQRQLPPAKFVFDEDSRRGTALDSLVSSGCVISGATVRRSVLFSKVRVDVGSLIEDSVVLPNVVVGRNVRLSHAVVDKHCRLPDGFCAGLSRADDEGRFHVTERGVTLITPDMLGQSGHDGNRVG
ncbi:MAG TPA: glucose-1-phosphate adenylyltransferase [Burkholderiaceae bacterium]|nr:glucose-1-phosphate adenylyltransferase [Burkholderiaceae bacterium]